VMKLLEVRKLDPKDRDHQYTFDDQGKEIIPRLVSIKRLQVLTGKTDRTIKRYRDILFIECLEYQTITCHYGIQRVPLLKRQAELILELSKLFDTYKDNGVAIAIYHESHPDPRDPRTTNAE
jgi:hypothetical protein